MSSTAQRTELGDGRWHFQHGPIDCIIGADGDARVVRQALDDAWHRFGSLLDELVAELPLLRTDVSQAEPAPAHGPVARRMLQACRALAQGGEFLTAMAAVAGSVAQELLAFFERPGIRRAYVNNGGDIALHLTPGTWFDIGLATQVEPRPGMPLLDGRFRIHAASGVRGVATSGWRGRSLSLGIADSVTVLAATAARADAAATVIANAVNLPFDGIVRVPASRVRDDSDLGERLVTQAVPPLGAIQVAQALDAGESCAQALIDAGLVLGAALCLQGRLRRCALGGDEPGPGLMTNRHPAPSLLHI